MSEDTSVAFEAAMPAPQRASIWRRVAIATKSAAKKVAGGCQRAALATKVAVIRTYLKIRPAVAKAARATRGAWGRALRPFLQLRIYCLGVVGAAIGLAIAPVATTAIFAATIGVLLGAVYGLPYLEQSSHPIHRGLLSFLRAAGTVLLVIGYAVAASATMAMCVVSVPYLLSSLTELALRHAGVQNPVLISVTVYSLFAAHWIQFVVLVLLGLLSWAVGGARDTSQAEDLPANRRVKLPACQACDEDADGPRLNLGKHRGLCRGCFDMLVEEQASELRRGRRSDAPDEDEQVAVSMVNAPSTTARAVIPQLRNKFVWIPGKERAKLEQVRRSESDSTHIYWAEVGWWYDGRGTRFTRRWDGYVAGRVTAAISYEHEKEKRGFYLSLPLLHGDERVGPHRRMADVQEMARRELFNATVVLDRTLEEISDEEMNADHEQEQAIPVVLSIEASKSTGS